MSSPRIPRRRAPIIRLGAPAWHDVTPLRIVVGVAIGLAVLLVWSFVITYGAPR
jgi:hypothetical protein